MQIQPYWQMATQYTLAEHMFTTQGSDSFTAHQDLIAGGTVVEPNRAMVDLPGCGLCMWGCDAPPGVQTHLITAGNKYLHIPGPFPCTTKFTTKYPTLRDLLDAKGISWKYYVPPCGAPCGGSKSTNFGMLMNAFDVIAAVRNGPEWGTSVVWPETKIFDDVASNEFPAVSWVIPIENNSDHPGTTQDNGPSWVASSSMQSARVRIGTRPRSSCYGTIGAASTTTPLLRRRPMADSVSASRRSSSRHMRGRGTSPRLNMSSAASCATSRTTGISDGRDDRQASDEHHRFLRLYAVSDQVQTDSSTSRQIVLLARARCTRGFWRATSWALPQAREGSSAHRVKVRRERAVVAQLDRATGYELVGWGFESLRPRFRFDGRPSSRRIVAPASGVVRPQRLSMPSGVLIYCGVETAACRSRGSVAQW